MSLIPKISLDKGKEFDYQKVFNECLIDVSKPVPPPPLAMSIGTHWAAGDNRPNNTFTYGEMSAIVAPQKHKKTFFKTAMIASYIGGKSTNYFPSVRSCRSSESYIIDVDTEQGPFYSYLSAKRVSKMTGQHYPNYLPFGTKKISGDNRVKLIDSIVNDPKFKGRIGLLVIDGIADLCPNFNNVEKSLEIIDMIQSWSNTGMHIMGVIHKTFDKDKAKGHLGTIFQQKIETSIFLKDTDPDEKNAPIEVSQKDSRGAPFDNFYFDLDLDVLLPKECEIDKIWS